MERWRWVPRDLGASHIEVNIPDFEAVVVEDGAIVQRYRVVVGKEKTPTPIFSDEMRYLIVNPYWNIPPSIIKNEFASDPGRLREPRLRGDVPRRADFRPSGARREECAGPDQVHVSQCPFRLSA